MIWRQDQISVQRWDIEGDDAEGYVITFEFETPDGLIRIMADAEDDERRSILYLLNAHIEGPGANRAGISNLRMLAALVLERSGYGTVKVEGATRTTGANPGRKPRGLWFPHPPRDAPEE